MTNAFNEKYNANLTAKAQSSDVCFRCHKQGHWAIDCPEGHEPESGQAKLLLMWQKGQP